MRFMFGCLTLPEAGRGGLSLCLGYDLSVSNRQPLRSIYDQLRVTAPKPGVKLPFLHLTLIGRT